MTIEDQPGFDPRLAWASEGGALLARVCPVLVVVDILRFTTAVDVAVTSGARLVPARDGPRRAGPARSSLSPVSLLGVPAGTRVVPSLS
jgi:2-phosphosulfolactate phosphatase